MTIIQRMSLVKKSHMWQMYIDTWELLQLDLKYYNSNQIMILIYLNNFQTLVQVSLRGTVTSATFGKISRNSYLLGKG